MKGGNINDYVLDIEQYIVRYIPKGYSVSLRIAGNPLELFYYNARMKYA